MQNWNRPESVMGAARGATGAKGALVTAAVVIEYLLNRDYR